LAGWLAADPREREGATAMGHGAVEFVVVAFRGTRIDPSLAAALRAQVERGTIRIIDLLFMQKDEDGNVRPFELDEVVKDREYKGFRGVAQEIDGLIAPDDVKEISDALPSGTTAMIVLFEHAWLRDLRRAVEVSGGKLVFSQRIPGEVVDAVAEAGAKEAAAKDARAKAAGAKRTRAKAA
jgi:hypothetical protein